MWTMASASLPHWMQWLADPLGAGSDGAWLMLALCTPLALAIFAAVVLWIRRSGPAGGALSLEGMLVGFPLAAAAMLLPVIIVPVSSRLPSGEVVTILGDRTLTLGLVQTALALAAIAILARNPLERPEESRTDWTALRPRDFGRTALAWLMLVPALQAALVAAVAATRLAGGEPEVQPILKQLVAARELTAIFGAYLLVTVAAPLAEEFAFRLVLYGGLRRLLGHWAALGLSAAAFVFVHDLATPGRLYLVAPMMLLSVALTLTYAHTRSLWPCVFFHALHNAFVLTLGYVFA